VNELPEGTLDTYRTELSAGKYANVGGLVIDVTKRGTINV
jgi:isoleucyl-tRNA synthetase